MLICKFCNKEFYNRNKKFCSVTCRINYNRIGLTYTEFCKQCGKPLEEKGWTKKFCNSSCSGKFNRKFIKDKPKKERICTKCQAKFLFYAGGSKFLCKSCKEKNDNNNEIIRNMTVQEYIDSHIYDQASNRHTGIRDLCRRWNKHLENKPCQNCGYSLHTEFCHIKEISKNKSLKLKEINDPSNILILCKNCHWEFDHGYLDTNKVLNNSKI